MLANAPSVLAIGRRQRKARTPSAPQPPSTPPQPPQPPWPLVRQGLTQYGQSAAGTEKLLCPCRAQLGGLQQISGQLRSRPALPLAPGAGSSRFTQSCGPTPSPGGPGLVPGLPNTESRVPAPKYWVSWAHSPQGQHKNKPCHCYHHFPPAPQNPTSPPPCLPSTVSRVPEPKY